MPGQLSPRERILARRAASSSTTRKPLSERVGDFFSGAWDTTSGMLESTPPGMIYKLFRDGIPSMEEHNKNAYAFWRNARENPGTTALETVGIPATDIREGNWETAAGKLLPGLLAMGAMAKGGRRAPAPAPPPRQPLLLPERTGPRFYAGEAGLADVTQNYKSHLGNPNPMIESGTPTLADVGDVIDVPPILAAEGVGRGGRPIPARSVPSSAGIDPIRSPENMAFEALVPNRYKSGQNINPTFGDEISPAARPYLAEDPRPMPSRIPDIEPLPKEGIRGLGARRPLDSDTGALPGGTQSRLRAAGVPEEQIQSMSIRQANQVLRTLDKTKKVGSGATPRAQSRLRENFPGNKVVEETIKQASERRPYQEVRDVDLETLSKLGDKKAIEELAFRKKQAGGFHIDESGVAVDPSEPRLSVLDRLRDETGAAGPGADDLMRHRARRMYNSPEEAIPDLARTRFGKDVSDLTPDEYWGLYQEGMDLVPDEFSAGEIVGEQLPSKKPRSFPFNEEGSVPLPTAKTVNFDAPIDAGGGKGNFFHRTVSPVFDRKFEDWVNARRATSVEGMLKKKEFKDLDNLGMQGITQFQRGIRSGRFNDIANYFDQKHQTLSQSGVRLGFKENYLPQLWENPAEEVLMKTKRLGLKPKFTLESVLENYEKGIAIGLKPKYKTLSELIGWYESRANKAIADRQFFDYLKENNLIRARDKAPNEWSTLNPDTFPVQKFKTKKGERELVYKAPKPIADAINSYLGEGFGPTRWVADKASLTKNIVLSAGVPGTGINAHGFNIAARNMMARGVVKGSMEAAKYLISPRSAKNWLEQNLTRAPEAIKHGLTLTTEEHQIGSVGSTHLIREPKTAVGKVANKGLNKVLEMHGKYFEDPLFQNIVPALKLKHWTSLTQDFIKQGMNPEAARRAAAQTTNSLYGGINWEAMQRSRDLQNLMRGIVLAPDWLESQYRIGKGMMNTLRDPRNPRGLPWKRAAANLIAAYVGADIVNYSINGHHMWENDPGHALDIKAGEVGGKLRYIRPFGTAADFARLPFDAVAGALQGDLSTTSNIAKNRRSTLLRLGSNLAMNQDDFGNPIFGEDRFGRPQSILTQLGKAGREVGEVATPQYVSGGIDYATGKAGSAEEAILGSIEAPVRYSRESTKKRARYRSRRSRPRR